MIVKFKRTHFEEYVIKTANVNRRFQDANIRRFEPEVGEVFLTGPYPEDQRRVSLIQIPPAQN